MIHTKILILGAGISAISLAHFLNKDDYLIVERDSEVGGYCKTITQDGFSWDYSGHFLHFKDDSIRDYVCGLLKKGLLTIQKDSKIKYKERLIDFPFQKNINQLSKDDLIDCLYYLVNRPSDTNTRSFKEMLMAKFGKGICQRFLFPYNEKLYSCDLNDLDVDAVGRFFPYASTEEIIRNFKSAKNESYNSTFNYPVGGIFELIKAFLTNVDRKKIFTNENVKKVDLKNKIVSTSKKEISYDYLVSTIPLDAFLKYAGLDAKNLSANKVLVFNFGFDRPSLVPHHWLYFPNPQTSFYRVGFYNNITGSDRMSVYVEIGFSREDEVDIDKWRERALEDLKKEGLLLKHKLVSSNHILLDPAYVHITKKSLSIVNNRTEKLKEKEVYLLGRYAEWTYSSIEDNIVHAKLVAEELRQK